MRSILVTALTFNLQPKTKALQTPKSPHNSKTRPIACTISYSTHTHTHTHTADPGHRQSGTCARLSECPRAQPPWRDAIRAEWSWTGLPTWPVTRRYLLLVCVLFWRLRIELHVVCRLFRVGAFGISLRQRLICMHNAYVSPCLQNI